MSSLSRLVPCLLLALAPACGGGGGSDAPDAAPTPDAEPPPCAPGASCTVPARDCLGLVDNQGDAKFGLRMSQLTLSSPAALTTGIVSSVIAGAVQPSLADCNVSGSGTFTWLLELDTSASTLKTGGARPVADPTTGYTFDDEVIDGAHVAPATAPLAIDAQGVFSHTGALDLIMPIFLDAGGTQSVLLPLSALTIGGTLSADQNCVGSYNAAGLDPASSCLGDADHPTYLDDGAISGHITLEAADGVVIAALNQSLCVLLSGDAATYGTGGNPNVCKRDGNGQILFHGDWCDATDAAATASCFDSVRIQGTFAASSVQLN